MTKKILCLSTGDSNGAYEALYRISRFCHSEGYFVKLLVKDKTKNDSFIIGYSDIRNTFYRKIRHLFYLLFKKTTSRFAKTIKLNSKYLFLNENEQSTLLDGKKIIDFIGYNPDLVIVGMTNGFLNTKTIAQIHAITGAKTYFVITDMYPLTGGCHYSWSCEGYVSDCNNCPGIVEGDRSWAKKNLSIKYKHISGMDAQAISMSGLATEQIKKSKIFNSQNIIYNVNSLIDLEVFNPNARSFAKTIFNVDSNAFTILIGSQSLSDERKGTSLVLDALRLCYGKLTAENNTKKIYIFLIGRDKDSTKSLTDSLLFETKFLEYITDYRLLSLLYQATDLFLCGSIEDTGPMMVSEALACGTPVVGFDTGVVSNMVVDNYNGFKVPIGDIEQFAASIKKIIKLSDDDFSSFSKNAFQQVEDFSSKKVCMEIINKICIAND